MNHPTPFSIGIERARGWLTVSVSGSNDLVDENYVPVSRGGIFRTPQPAGAVGLRIRAGGNAADSAAGTGARSIRLTGLNAQGELISELLAAAGTSASALTTNKFIRLFSAKVDSSGTYASQQAGSHVADILIEDEGGLLWAEIPRNGFPESTSRVGAYTIPKGYEGYITSYTIQGESAKIVDALLFTRPNILETAAPYSSMTTMAEAYNVTGLFPNPLSVPLFVGELSDVGFLARVSGQTARVLVDFQLILRTIR